MISKRPEIFETTLLHKEEVAPNILEVHFLAPDDFEFVPGQFVNIYVDEKQRRAYSIAEHIDDKLVFYVELLPFENKGLASEFFREAKIGLQTKMQGPLGRFTYKKTTKPKVFIATGTGIAPFLPMIKELSNSDIPLHFYFGTRKFKDDFMTPLVEWKSYLKDMEYMRCLSRERLDTYDSFTYQGRVTSALESADLDFKECEFYICGGTEMIKDVRELLKSKGAEDIYFERYY